MPNIQPSEIKYYLSAIRNNTSANGGRESSTESIAGLSASHPLAMLPWIDYDSRIAGTEVYRKIHLKVDNALSEPLFVPELYLLYPPMGDTHITIGAATNTDTQGDLTGSEKQYGVGLLTVAASINDTSITVNTRSAALGLFTVGDKIIISNLKRVVSSGVVGREQDGVIAQPEYRTLTSVSYSGDVATLGFATGLYYAHAIDTLVASILQKGSEIKCSYTTPVVTSVAGTFNTTTYPIQLNNLGTVTQQWTFTFASSTAFTLSGDVLGNNIASGNTTSNFAPNNPAVNQPYFTILKESWGGTWALGNTVTWPSYPATFPFWLKHKVPPNSAYANITTEIRLNGQGI